VAHGGDEVGLEPVELLERGVGGLQLPVLLLQLPVGLLHRLDVEPRRQLVLVAGEDQHVHQVAEVLDDLLGGGLGHPPDLLQVAGGQLLVEVLGDAGQALRQPDQVLRDEGPEDDPPDDVALVDHRLHAVAAAGEAVEDGGLGLLGHLLALHPAHRGDALGAPVRLLPDVAAEVGVPDLHVHQLVALGVEDLEAHAVQLGERLADLAEGLEVDQLAQRGLGLQDGRRQGHRGAPTVASLVPRMSTWEKMQARNSCSEIFHLPSSPMRASRLR